MPLEKRSLTLEQHQTSVALEPEFWAELEAWADRDGRSVTSVIEEIDRTRPESERLASTLRVAVLERLKQRSDG
ncbi:ribbon-helix-helix domain-containing protein [Amorphus orientalis]|uniref:DNA-binding ribbon-helix-helix protein n=1 Tax=Amorphus orientalis TaxID=649198 RepID=A0AAE3VNE5_9HYPH|nr:ribbon-helix-helix domain-containing protein [Amorphus orientalis]MDQ0315278.1 putative DNA-binding ribbon-helix-helix protein [Amorphus orientalis]